MSLFENIKSKLLNSPTILKIAKTVVILVIVLILIQLIVMVVKKYTSILKRSPWLLKGTKIGTNPLTLQQNPDEAGSITVQRSHNNGIGFTYSVWLYINAVGDDADWKHVFHKGSPDRYPLFTPGVWLSGNKNALRVKINTFDETEVKLDVDNLPIKKWFHLAVYVNQTSLDVWINGNMVESKRLNSLPKQNDGNVYITHNGGFNGYISNLQYFAYSLPYYKLENIMKYGPETASCIDTGDKPPYFNKEWWLMK